MTRAPLAVAGLLLVLPAAADAATLTTDRQCYVQAEGANGLIQQTLTANGTGWVPNSTWGLSAEGIEASGPVDTAGNFTAAGNATAIDSARLQPQTFTLSGTQDGTEVATAEYSVVNFLVKPKSPDGNPTGTTSWWFGGFTPSKSIYVHVKRGKKVYTQKAGKGDETCGTLRKRLRRLPAVPSSKIEFGTYKIFVDNRRKFSKGGLQYRASIRIRRVFS